MYSMTGYSKIIKENDNYRICVEVKSVNNKNLNLRIKSSSIFNFLDNKIKTLISNHISRGYIELKIDFEDKTVREDIFSYDRILAKNYLSILEQMEKELHISIKEKEEYLLKQSNIIITKNFDIDEDFYAESILDIINESLIKLKTMKKTEGDKLKKYIKELKNDFEKCYNKIEELKGKVVEDYISKLKERLRKFELNIETEKDDLHREILIYADRSDISEEISRLESHISQFNEELEEDKNGKKLDFLLQEMFREINTIGAKANCYKISKEVVESKTILEKMREQIQNVE